MSNTESLNKLLQYRDKIEDILVEIDALLQVSYSEEYPIAYQHWLPQIRTALRNDTKWLPRGEYSMDYTLDRILDKITNDTGLGVNKTIK